MTPTDKPLGKTIGWSVHQSTYLYQSHWFHLRQDTYSIGDQTEGTYTYIEHPGSVFVVPMTGNHQMLLIRSYRFTLDTFCWEVPAGTLADRTYCTPEEAALRELEEETGATCGSLIKLGQYYLGNGFANHLAHFFLAQDTKRSAAARPNAHEQITEVATLDIDDVASLIRSGAVNDGDSAFALLLALHWLDQRTVED